LTGIGPQTLRLYERRGLLTPARTSGGTRRYSDDDLVRLARIAQLMEDGVNVPGIQRILALEAENVDLASRLEGSEGGSAGE
jgi:DNA-binding transcriptional MerR regulator